jgi:choline dehydrogenase-like flavoprotein
MLVWAFKKQREIVRWLDCYRGELAQSHPPYPEASKAASVKLHGPLPRPVHDIEYTAEDDAILEDWLYKKVAGTWHSIGTCKMAPQSKGGVIDASLSVYGVSGLKLADLSITPGNLSANTANVAYAIGEKAAAIFKAELGLK